MHPATNSVKCTFPSAEPESDVVCVYGSCGSKGGICQRVPLEVEAVQNWPTMALKSRSNFKSYAARRKDLKGKDKGNQWILTQVPFLWFVLRRRRTVLPHLKVQVM